MKVLLKEDVEHLGYAGEVHQVADGFGRNYLLPRGVAVLATPAALKQAAAWRARAEARREQIRAEYTALSNKIQGVTLEFAAKAGPTGRLYGSVTTAQIAEALNEQLGTEIDRRRIESESLRDLGEHTLSVRLDKDHTPTFTVIIKSEEEDMLAAMAAAAAEAQTIIETDYE